MSRLGIRGAFSCFVGCASIGLSSLACSSADPTGSGGEGTVTFTTWGEEFIEGEIPPASGDDAGFVDGWTLRYDKFLVNFQNIVIADMRGATAASMSESKLFDNVRPNPKAIVEFENVEAKAWDRVSYEIAPVTAESELVGGVPQADKDMMIAGAYSLYTSGTASKGDVEKRFAWGFALGTRYDECRSEQGGREEDGIVVTNNGSMEVELTTHGDHLFYDRLQSSPTIETSLRFDALAAADTNDDGEVTLEELTAKTLDVRLYDPSGLGAANHGTFVAALARTVGHFRGEGECTISAL
jgi:hypothetical protein